MVSERTVATSAEIGSHWAIARGTASMPAMGTNVPAMNVSGRMMMNPIPCIASGERTSIPNSTPHQVKAKMPRAINATSSTARAGVR